MAHRTFQTEDGIAWRVEVQVPGSSNAMVVFRHPDRTTTRRDRYAWYNAQPPDARNVKVRLDPARVLEQLDEARLALLFRRSMLVSAADNPLGIPVTQFSV